MIPHHPFDIDHPVSASHRGWRKLMLQPLFYVYLVAVFFLLDTVIALLLNPINADHLSAIEVVQISFLVASIICLLLVRVLKQKSTLLYLMLVLIMVYPTIIISNNLMDLRMSVHYMPIAFLIQVGQQNKKLSYKTFFILTLILLGFFLFLVLKPNINIDETSTVLKIQMLLSMLYSGILVFLGVLVQKARSYYIIIEERLIDQIAYVTDEFSKTTSFQSSLYTILQNFEEKTNHFFERSTCSFILNSETLVIMNIEDEEQNASTYFQPLSHSKNKLFQQVFADRKSVQYGNAYKRELSQDKNCVSAIVVPILFDEEVIGIIHIINSAPYFFNESHLHLTEIIASICASKILEFKNRQLNYQTIEFELESRQLSELDELKHNFIENISRNIKSPIQNILNNARRLDQDVNDNTTQKLLQLIHSNGNQLKGIVDQLLELNEIDVTAMELNLERIDIGRLIHGWQDTFLRIARNRNITVSLLGSPSLEVIVDEKKITSIIHNLVNNALKYTPKNGEVKIIYSLIGNMFSFRVNDSGNGIPPKFRTKIFDRFFRLGEADGQGTGIGLSIVKELTEILGGEISIEDSDLGGASFHFSYNIAFVEGFYPPNTHETTTDEFAMLRADKPVILVVDDHDEMREFISNCLSENFNCIQANNGKVGLQKAKKVIPDLIITDLMMPEMTGEELCSTIRDDEELNHIPIVVLSAKSTGENKITLYEIGADNYLVKPFEVDELRAIVLSLLQTRNQLREQFKSHFMMTDSISETFENRENVFLEKVSALISKNISNSDFNVVSLCNALALGRNQVARKIKALTNMTPVEFIRESRLKEAATLLISTNQSVSEIAYQTGFSNLSYFTKTFKTTFGILPSDYKKG